MEKESLFQMKKLEKSLLVALLPSKVSHKSKYIIYFQN